MPKKTKKEEVTKKTEKKPEYFQAVGRRKEATCRARLYVVGNGHIKVGEKTLKPGDMLINNMPIEQFFSGEIYKKIYLEPFRTTNTTGRFAVSALSSGGGVHGQLGAFVHAVSRALQNADKEKFRPILKKKGLLTRDSRMKERRKAGLAQSARAKKQSPKR